MTDRDMLLLAYGAICASEDERLQEIQEMLTEHLFSISAIEPNLFENEKEALSKPLSEYIPGET